jgi:hypothetical protein
MTRSPLWIWPFIAVASLVSPAGGEVVRSASRIDAFVRVCEEARRGTIAQLEHQLRGLRSEDRPSPRSSRQIAKIEADLRALRENKQVVVPALRFPPEVGAIGRIPRLTCRVDRIISQREMLVRCSFPVKVANVEHFRARGETLLRPVTFLIRGLPTDEVNAGTDLELLQVFEISGSAAYKSADGRTSSVLVLSEFDMKAVEPQLRAAATGSAR